MRRTDHHSQGKTAEAPGVPPFESLGEYLEQRKEALTHGVVPLIRIERMTYCLQDSCSTN